jgi:hypothetical protein
LNIRCLKFEFVSDFDIRISDFALHSDSPSQEQLMYQTSNPHSAGLYLEGVTVSVNYADFLDETLTANLDHFDEFCVVTAHDDRATQAVCDRHGVICVKTDVHRELLGPGGGLDRFNKGLMINLGLAHLRHRGWLLHLDADIVLPDRLRFMLNKSRLDDDCLYGADRVNVIGRENWEAIKQSGHLARQYQYRYLVGPAVHALVVPPSGGNCRRRPPKGGTTSDRTTGLRLGSRLIHNEYGYCPIGCFQLWHSRHVGRRYHFSQGSAEHSDVLFALQWPAAKRVLLPGVFVYHLESESAKIGANWQGRTTKGF